jgi:hypothetical protein
MEDAASEGFSVQGALSKRTTAWQAEQRGMKHIDIRVQKVRGKARRSEAI